MINLLTMEELCKILNLELPEDFCKKIKESRKCFPMRSGRTTTMLLKACLKAQTEKAYIVGYRLNFTRVLQKQAKEMCNIAKINSKNIPFIYFTKEAIQAGNLVLFTDEGIALDTASNVFIDHYTGDNR